MMENFPDQLRADPVPANIPSPASILPSYQATLVAVLTGWGWPRNCWVRLATSISRICNSLRISGSICMDLLVADGWLPSYNIAAVLLQIRMAVSSTEPRPARLAQNWQTPYGVQEALDGLFYLFIFVWTTDTPSQDFCVLRALMVGQFLTELINWFYDDGIVGILVLVPLPLFVHLSPMFALRFVRPKVFRPCPTSFRAASTSTTASATSRLRSFAYGTTVVIAGGAFVAYYSDSRSAIHQYVFAPLLRTVLDGEVAHKLALRMLRSGLHPKDRLDDDARLKVQVRM